MLIRFNGTCARCARVEFSEDGNVSDVRFVGGCDGQGKAVARLVRGMSPSKVVSLLEGIQCGNKGTSCADQLARGLREYVKATGKDGENA